MGKRLQSLRNPDLDYGRQGYWFVTFNTKWRYQWLGAVRNGEMHITPFGEILEACWRDLANHYPNFKQDMWVVMPDHFHCIIRIDNSDYRKGLPDLPRQHGLSEMVRALKSFSSRRINEKLTAGELQPPPGFPPRFQWQPKFWDVWIEDQHHLSTVRTYLLRNPERWREPYRPHRAP